MKKLILQRNTNKLLETVQRFEFYYKYSRVIFQYPGQKKEICHMEKPTVKIHMSKENTHKNIIVWRKFEDMRKGFCPFKEISLYKCFTKIKTKNNQEMVSRTHLQWKTDNLLRYNMQKFLKMGLFAEEKITKIKVFEN